MTFRPPEQGYDPAEFHTAHSIADETVLHDLAHTIPQASASFQQQLEDSLIAHLHYQQKENTMKRKRKPMNPLPLTMMAAIVTLFIAGGIFFVMQRDTNSPDMAAPISTVPETCDSGWTGTYRVIQGDNFLELSKRFRVPLEEMLRENCINTPPQLIDADIVLNVPQQKVLVASEDINPHHVLTADNVRLVSINTDVIPDNAILDLDDAVGEISMTSIRRGQIIVEEMVFNDTGFQVVTATRDITPGITLDASMLQIAELPAFIQMDGQYFPEVDLLIGQTTALPLDAEEIIAPEHLVNSDSIAREEYLPDTVRIEQPTLYLPGTPIIIEPVKDRGDINNERIILRNSGETTMDISGWTISDMNGNRHTLEDGASILPGGTFTIYTGKGINRQNIQYMHLENALWGNFGEQLVISDGKPGGMTLYIALDTIVYEDVIDVAPEITGVIGAGRYEAEGIQIYNPGDTLDITGWSLSDENNNTYTFSETRLFADTEVTVYTRHGQDTPINFYQNRNDAILTHGETVTLHDSNGQIRAEFMVDMFDLQPENQVALALAYPEDDQARYPIVRGDIVDVISVMNYVDINDATHPEQLTGQAPEAVRTTLQHPIKGALVLYSGEAAEYPPLGNVPLLNDVNIHENVVVLLLPEQDAEIMKWMLENDFPYTFALRR